MHNWMALGGSGYHKKILLCAFSGVLLALSLPRFELWYLAFIALVPLFFALEGERGFRAFLLGFVSGFLFYLISLFWITEAMRNYSALGFLGSVAVLLLLVVWLACLIGVFGNVVSLCGSSPLSVVFVPMFWVALELVKAKLMSGFPWNNLCWAVYRQTTIIQIADTLGSYGVSFVLVLMNWSLFAVLAGGLRKVLSVRNLRIGGTALLTLGVVLGYGKLRLCATEPAGPPVRVGIIQPNIPEEVKLSPRRYPEMLAKYERLFAELPARSLDLVVLPEAAITVPYNLSVHSQRWVERTFGHKCSVLFGAIARTPVGFTNSAFLVDRSGRTERYDKVHLVPFGEYNPFPRLLAFVRVLAGYEGSLAKGLSHNVLSFGRWKVGVPICYEIIFPEIVGEFVNNGADLICTISNDAWFGRTSGPYQHFAACVFRAIENRVPVLRCANTGVSGLVNPDGRIVLRTPIFVERTDLVTVRLWRLSSPYRRWGDLFAYLCLAGAILAGLRNAWRLRRLSPQAWGPVPPYHEP